MDLITSLPETAAGDTAIVAFICRLTEMVHLPNGYSTGWFMF